MCKKLVASPLGKQFSFSFEKQLRSLCIWSHTVGANTKQLDFRLHTHSDHRLTGVCHDGVRNDWLGGSYQRNMRGNYIKLEVAKMQVVSVSIFVFWLYYITPTYMDTSGGHHLSRPWVHRLRIVESFPQVRSTSWRISLNGLGQRLPTSSSTFRSEVRCVGNFSIPQGKITVNHLPEAVYCIIYIYMYTHTHYWYNIYIYVHIYHSIVWKLSPTRCVTNIPNLSACHSWRGSLVDFAGARPIWDQVALVWCRFHRPQNMSSEIPGQHVPLHSVKFGRNQE